MNFEYNVFIKLDQEIYRFCIFLFGVDVMKDTVKWIIEENPDIILEPSGQLLKRRKICPLIQGICIGELCSKYRICKKDKSKVFL